MVTTAATYDWLQAARTRPLQSHGIAPTAPSSDRFTRAACSAWAWRTETGMIPGRHSASMRVKWACAAPDNSGGSDGQRRGLRLSVQPSGLLCRRGLCTKPLNDTTRKQSKELGRETCPQNNQDHNRNLLSPNPPMRSGLGVGTRGEGRGTRRSALDSDKWGRWRPLVVVGGADGGPGQRRWGGVGGTACRGRQSRTGPVRLCGSVG